MMHMQVNGIDKFSLLEFNKIDEFRKKGANVDFGAFGENLVIEGIELKYTFYRSKNKNRGCIIRSYSNR